MKAQEKKCYESLSPFELKNKLIEIAESNNECMMLNAGRGNPNWIATVPRQAFFQLGLFGLEESLRVSNKSGQVSGVPDKVLMGKRFFTFLKSQEKSASVLFLKHAVRYVQQELSMNLDDFLGELVHGILGDNYPEPESMLSHSERILHEFLAKEMCGGVIPSGKLDLFATEGGTGAISNVFSSLMENHLLRKGDKVALGTPIFTPYLEIPHLNNFELIKLEIRQSEALAWQYPDSEIEKLADPSVKAFFLVHPSNPTSVSMHPETLEKIGKLVRTKRKDLIILTDDVYGTFVNQFRSLVAVAPFNTILIYSFSKYFGATGWRLGAIGIHQKNVFDKMISSLPQSEKDALFDRYRTIAVSPQKMKLIDRMVADSRTIAFHHTAGLSTPQQVMMTLFSLYSLLDRKDQYKKTTQAIVKDRKRILYKALGLPFQDSPYDTNYYTVIDLPKLAEIHFGKPFADYLVQCQKPIDWVVNLASKKSVVLMNGGGFNAPSLSVRVSLANLPDAAYKSIGEAIVDLLNEYYAKLTKSMSGRCFCETHGKKD